MSFPIPSSGGTWSRTTAYILTKKGYVKYTKDPFGYPTEFTFEQDTEKATKLDAWSFIYFFPSGDREQRYFKIDGVVRPCYIYYFVMEDYYTLGSPPLPYQNMGTSNPGVTMGDDLRPLVRFWGGDGYPPMFIQTPPENNSSNPYEIRTLAAMGYKSFLDVTLYPMIGDDPTTSASYATFV